MIILRETNGALEQDEALSEEAMLDLTRTIMNIEPVRQALLFQVIVPFYANQVYATKAQHKGSIRVSVVDTMPVNVQVTNQLHPPGYSMTINFVAARQGYQGWAEWMDEHV